MTLPGCSDDEDGAEDVPLVAIDAAVADALAESPDVKHLMELIQMAHPANQQEQVRHPLKCDITQNKPAMAYT